MKKIRITIYPNKQFKDTIQDAAYSSNRSMSNFVLNVLAEYLNFNIDEKEEQEHDGTGQSIGDNGDGFPSNGIPSDGI